jgi:hypothetical protein
MKTRFIISMAMVSLALSIGAFPALSADITVEQQRSYYLKFIDEEIESCESKQALTGSRSKNLQNCGTNAMRRKAFLVQNRDFLVQEMVVQKVNMRPHAIHQYLLQRCNQELGSAKAKKEL